MSDLSDSDRPAGPTERLLELLLQGANGYALFTTDSRGQVVSWNSGAEAVFGWDEAEIVGQSAEVLFVPEDRLRGVPAMELGQAAEEGLAPDIRWHQRKDGGRVFINGSVQPLLDVEGRLSGFLKIGRDLTGERETEAALRHSEEKYATLFDTIDQGVVFGRVERHADGIVDLRIEAVNPALIRLLGAAPSTTPGQSSREAWPQLEEAWYEKLLEVVRTGKSSTLEAALPSSRRWLSVGFSPFGKLDNRDVAVVVTDITERRQAEQDRLERDRKTALLAERTRMAQELHDTLAQALTGIKLQIHLAEHALKGGDSALDEALRHLETAKNFALESHAEARRAIEGLRVPLFESLTLNAALRSLVRQFEPDSPVILICTSQEIQLSYEIQGDVVRVAQEALTNALRHAGASRIEVRLAATPAGFRLEVHDNGRGFDPDTTREGHGMTGMRERAARIGAELELEGALGQGTRVSLSLTSR